MFGIFLALIALNVPRFVNIASCQIRRACAPSRFASVGVAVSSGSASDRPPRYDCDASTQSPSAKLEFRQKARDAYGDFRYRVLQGRFRFLPSPDLAGPAIGAGGAANAASSAYIELQNRCRVWRWRPLSAFSFAVRAANFGAASWDFLALNGCEVWGASLSILQKAPF